MEAGRAAGVGKLVLISRDIGSNDNQGTAVYSSLLDARQALFN
jgi:hypothetical protein